MSCNGWYKLEELLKIKYGKNQKKVQDNENGIYPIYGTGGLMGYSKEYLYNKPSILIGRKGSISRVKYVEHPFWTVDTLFYTEINENLVIPKYLYYKMSMIDFNFYNEGTTIPSLRTDTLNKIEFQIHSLEEQEKIVNILSSLDDKIELNNEMNKTLEEMAQSIFKRWFVDFEFPNENGEPYKSSGGEMIESELGMIPKGWEVKELGEVININPRESLKKGEEKIYVEMANLPLNYARITNYIEKPFNGGTKFRNGDTLLARITPCLENGKTAIVDFLEENDLAFGSTEYIVMRPKVLNQYYIYCLSRNEDFRNYAIKNMNGSSGRQRVDANTIKQYRIPCPDENTLELYNQFCVSLFNQMKKNDDESKVLGDIRDTLLPKLMSGDIK